MMTRKGLQEHLDRFPEDMPVRIPEHYVTYEDGEHQPVGDIRLIDIGDIDTEHDEDTDEEYLVISGK